MFTTIFDTFAVLLVIASFLGYLNHKFVKLPFAIGLMAGGLVASIIIITLQAIYPIGLAETVRDQLLHNVNFADTLMHGMLSFLLFAGAMHTDMSKLKKWAAPIGLLATFGVLISSGLIGVMSYAVFDALDLGVPFAYCLVFGALITPTDPVAVLGIMRQAGAPEDVEIKVVGESLFNDGIAVVLFTVLLSIATVGTGAAGHGEEMGIAAILSLIAIEAVGGVALGLAGGYIVYLAMRRIDEPNLETLMSVSLVMGLTFVAFQLHTSAPLACVVAGLFVGNHGWEEAMTDPTRQAMDIIWSFIDEALNAVLFLLIGIEIIALSFTVDYILAGVILIVVSLAARGVSVFIPIAALKRRLDIRTGTRRVLWWGGIKGGISIALALSLPEFPGREAVLAVTYAVVVVSVLAQGLTIGKLIERVMPDITGEPATQGH